MPIYEYACPKCRTIFNFLSKRINPDKKPSCPRCGNPEMVKKISRFSFIKGVPEPKQSDDEFDDGPPVTKEDEQRMMRVMSELEKDIDHLDENNPKHLAYMMKKFKEALPKDLMPKEMDEAIRRLEDGEDPEKIEEDMGEVFDQVFGPSEEEDEYGYGGGYGGYSRDDNLYEL